MFVVFLCTLLSFAAEVPMAQAEPVEQQVFFQIKALPVSYGAPQESAAVRYRKYSQRFLWMGAGGFFMPALGVVFWNLLTKDASCVELGCAALLGVAAFIAGIPIVQGAGMLITGTILSTRYLKKSGSEVKPVFLFISAGLASITLLTSQVAPDIFFIGLGISWACLGLQLITNQIEPTPYKTEISIHPLITPSHTGLALTTHW
jgi:hypothetical protein